MHFGRCLTALHRREVQMIKGKRGRDREKDTLVVGRRGGGSVIRSLEQQPLPEMCTCWFGVFSQRTNPPRCYRSAYTWNMEATYHSIRVFLSAITEFCPCSLIFTLLGVSIKSSIKYLQTSGAKTKLKQLRDLLIQWHLGIIILNHANIVVWYILWDEKNNTTVISLFYNWEAETQLSLA